MGQALKLVASVSFDEDSDGALIIQRMMKSGEKRPSKALRRIVMRYAQMLAETPPPKPEMLMLIARALGGHKLCYGYDYPDIEVMRTNILNSAHINKNEKQAAVNYIMGITFAEYARLCEALEAL